MNNLLVEGHVENWVLIVDLNGSGVFSTIGVIVRVNLDVTEGIGCDVE